MTVIEVRVDRCDMTDRTNTLSGFIFLPENEPRHVIFNSSLNSMTPIIIIIITQQKPKKKLVVN